MKGIIFFMKGKVKTFNKQKGYGFINSLEVDGDIFFHYSTIEMEGFKTIDVGVEVEFELESSDKGKRAKKVKVLDEQ